MPLTSESPMRTLLKLCIVMFALLAGAKLMKTGSLSGTTLELPLELQPISGSPVQAGKPTIVEFWATWCPPCRQTIPHLNQIYTDYHGKGLQIVGITDEDAG